MNHLAASALDIEHLEQTADVVPIRNETLFRRLDEAHVAERRALGDVRVVCTEGQADEEIVAEIEVRDLGVRERLAEAGGRHDVGVAPAFELDDVCALDRRLALFRCSPPSSA